MTSDLSFRSTSRLQISAKGLRLECLGVHPPITGIYKPAGDNSKQSDRQNMQGKNPAALTLHIVFSVRLNLEKLLRGDNIIVSQWPSKTMMKEFDRSTFIYPEGKAVNITLDEYAAADKKAEESKLAEEAKKQAKVEAEKQAEAEKVKAGV